MNISTIPSILINGQNVYPYGLDYAWGGSDPSELTLKFVNKDGNYTIPARNVDNLVKIKIGNFYNVDGYVVTAEQTSATNGGKILTVKYRESSLVLDKTVIGLKGIHGLGFTTDFFGSKSPDLILVGTQINPCDEVGELPTDPCAPACEERNDEREKFDCAKEKAIKILQVDYSFAELKAAVSSKVAFGSFPAAINIDYRASYTGSLRSVLQSWCADFGIGFYWQQNAIYFYDLFSGIQIDDAGIDTGTKVTNLTETWSIADNVAKAKVVYFGAEGEEREYSCTASASKALVLTQVTLYDLLTDTTRGGETSPADDFIKNSYDPQNRNSSAALSYFYDSIILSYYSDKLRDLYFTYEREGLVSAAAVDAWIAAKKKPIQALGAMRPVACIHPLAENPSHQAAYNSFLTLLDTSDAAKVTAKGGFFVIAEYDESRHQKYSRIEESLAVNFLGKYWIRPFADGGRYSYDAPDGNVTYYSNGSVIQFPFLNDLPSSIQKSSDFLQDLIESAEVNGEGEISNTASHGKFIMLERTAIWSPAKNSKTIEDLVATVEPFTWKKTTISKEDIEGLNLAVSPGESIFTPPLVVFIAYPKPEKLDLKITKSANQEQNHPIDSANVGLLTELNGQNVAHGLRSALTTYFIIKSNGTNIQIHAPSQAGLKYGNEYGGYTVIANGDTFTNNIKVVVPKKEIILGDSPTSTSLDVASEIVFKDATQNLVKFLQSSGAQTCGYDDAAIRALLLRFNSRQQMPRSIERVTKTYEISGIPQNRFSPSQGLQNFSIVIGDSGVRTSVTFSNLPVSNKSEALEEKRFEEIAVLLGKAKNYFRK